MQSNLYDVVIIGEGAAGLTAANTAAALGLKVASMEANLFGGLVVNIAELEGYPAGNKVSGVDVASALMQQNADLGVENIPDTVTGLGAEGDIKLLHSAQGVQRARSVVIASGARMKKLGVPGEQEFEYRGVSQCADCDGPLFKDADVMIVGGGDAALQEALTLAEHCRKVSIVLRGDRPRARHHFVERVRAKPNVELIKNTVLEEITGGQTVEKVRLRTGSSVREVPASGVFVFIGLQPTTEFAGAEIKRDAAGLIVTDSSMQTSVPGIFAAGAARSGYSGRLLSAMGEGTVAALSAARHLASA
jgi:thioredoxin reductase (NADPH)